MTFPGVERAAGVRIQSIRHDDDQAVIDFADGSQLVLRDAGQRCCEDRYLTCDDDLPSFAGAEFLDAEVADSPSDDGGCHEVQFLRVLTTKGVATFETHNDHNGMYSGFNVTAKFSAAPRS